MPELVGAAEVRHGHRGRVDAGRRRRHDVLPRPPRRPGRARAARRPGGGQPAQGQAAARPAGDRAADRAATASSTPCPRRATSTSSGTARTGSSREPASRNRRRGTIWPGRREADRNPRTTSTASRSAAAPGSVFQLLTEAYSYSGVEKFYDGGKSTVADPRNAELVRKVAELYKKATPEADVNNNYTQMVAQFTGGTVAMMHHNLGSTADVMKALGTGTRRRHAVAEGAVGQADRGARTRPTASRCSRAARTPTRPGSSSSSWCRPRATATGTRRSARSRRTPTCAEPSGSQKNPAVKMALGVLEDPATVLVPAPVYLPRVLLDHQDRHRARCTRRCCSGQMSAQEFLDRARGQAHRRPAGLGEAEVIERVGVADVHDHGAHVRGRGGSPASGARARGARGAAGDHRRRRGHRVLPGAARPGAARRAGQARAAGAARAGPVGPRTAVAAARAPAAGRARRVHRPGARVRRPGAVGPGRPAGSSCRRGSSPAAPATGFPPTPARCAATHTGRPRDTGRLRGLREAAGEPVGYRAIKLHTWMPPVPGAPSVAVDIEACQAVRDAVGPDVALMLDASHWYSRTEALRLGKALQELDFYWFEEPMEEASISSYRWLAEQLDIPVIGPEVAWGKHMTRAEWISGGRLRHPAGRPGGCGGITPVLKTVHLAESFNMDCEIHGNGSGSLTRARRDRRGPVVRARPAAPARRLRPRAAAPELHRRPAGRERDRRAAEHTGNRRRLEPRTHPSSHS